MERKVSLDEISDGKLYGLNDMVRADSGGCEGCSACCRGMGTSVILDPLDVFRLTTYLGVSFEQLLTGPLQLNVVDGIILPNIRMDGQEEACPFLNQEGRCSVHPGRPGFCRLFPLGRIYENRTFRYFLQTRQCIRENRSKVKVRKWIDTPDVKEYERFIGDWHYLLKDLEAGLKGQGNQELRKKVNMYLLNTFYITPYRGGESFYPQFYSRLTETLAFAAALEIKIGIRTGV